MPFSDPLADGATMQRANARALEGGATLDTALDLARFIRQRSPETPVALMSYYNPLRQRGDAQFAADLAPLAPTGRSCPTCRPKKPRRCSPRSTAPISPSCPSWRPPARPARIRAVAALEPAFIYCVALVGVTGARQDLSARSDRFLSDIRAETSAPLVVGFGISQPSHVQRAAELGADGVIVASALADLVERSTDPVAAARAYLHELKQAASAAVTS